MPLTILRPYYLGLKNRTFPRDGSRQYLKRDLLLLAIALLVMGCIYFGFILLFNSLKGNPFFEMVIPKKIIQLLSYTFFVLITISNTVAIIGNLYLSDNMSLFLTLPISQPRLYLAKVIETLTETCLMLLIFVLPAVLAYYHSYHVGISFVAAGVLVAAPFLLTTAGLAVVLATLFLNFVSLFWRRGLLFLICLLALAGWGLTRLVALLAQLKMQQGGGTSAIIQLIGLFDNPNPIWLPSRWVADILTSFLGEPLQDANWKFTLLCGTGFGMLALGYIFFDLFTLPLRSTAAALQRHTTKKGTQRRDIVRELLESIYWRLPIEQQTRAMILKDLSTLVRDQGQALQLLLYLGIAAVYVVIFKFMGTVLNIGPLAYKAWLGFLASINILFAGLVITALMTRLVYPSVSLEGKSFWILQITPIKVRKLIQAKFWCWLPITGTIAISLAMAGALAIGIEARALLATALIAFSFSIGSTGLAVGIGSIFASFDWESPSQIAVGLGTLVLLLFGLAMVLILSIPASILTFFAAVPEYAHNFGDAIAFLIMSGAFYIILATNFFVAKIACDRGAASLVARTNK